MGVAATATRMIGGRRRRITIAALAAAVALLLIANIAISVGPVGTGLVTGPLVALILVVVARRAGLSWDDLGLSRRRLRRGAAWAGVAVLVVAAVYLVAVALPWMHEAFLDARYRLDAGPALVKAMVMVPVSTILLEEVAFRGVLFGLLHRRRRTAWAFGFSSALFGLWHVLPALPGTTFETVAAVVGITACLGLVLCELRRRSGSLLAAIAGHWAANGLGVLLAALVWSWQ